MSQVLVIDACSLINYFKYYYFDKYNANTVNKTLREFIISKIESDEIIVIDKVFDELIDSRDNLEFKEEIEDKVVDTTRFLTDVKNLSKKYYIVENEQFFNNDQNRIDAELQNAESKNADLYLIALCLSLKRQGKTPVLITEETTNTRAYNKLIHKIPKICRDERIEYRNMPYSLFEIYKQKLEFKLNIN